LSLDKESHEVFAQCVCGVHGSMPQVPQSKEIAMKRLTLIAICAAALLVPNTLFAQVPPPSRTKQDALAGHATQTYQRHARENAHILYYYNQAPQPMPVAEAKAVVATVQQNLTAADKALAKLKAEHAKEPEVMKLITTIEKHHAKAHEACGMASEHCLKEHPDQAGIANCCTAMWTELTAAEKETEKLLKLLKIEKLEPPKATVVTPAGK
jgi:hypothetical protein